MLVETKFDSVLKVNSVDARELHKVLEVGRGFSEWIKSRIDDTMAESNVDFIKSPVLGSRGIKKNCVIRIDYKITLNLAKKIAVLERNEAGKKFRNYFI
jgi:phage anti-repressor protein